jgi:hypothetical protein
MVISRLKILVAFCFLVSSIRHGSGVEGIDNADETNRRHETEFGRLIYEKIYETIEVNR